MNKMARRGKKSPTVDIDMTVEEAKEIIEMMADELKITKEAMEIAEEEIEEIMESKVIQDLEEYVERDWVWFTVIPSRREEEKGGE